MGKSRFISQVVELVHADGALVLAGGCESDLAVPYQPFAAAFADVPAGDDELAAAVADGVGPLGPLFPAHRRGGLDDAGPSARFELFEAVFKLVDRLAIEQPLVLVLEDLQWANRSTIQLLRHLLRQATDVRLLLLASYRPEEIGATHPLHELLADTSASLTRVDLAPLGPPEIGELVQTRLPVAPAEGIGAFARRVHEESAGSPFFVCELLHHLSATGELERLVGAGSGDRLPIPDTVREVVGQRLGRLSDEAGPILSTAAVIGLTFDLELLSELVDGDADTVLETLEGVAQVALVSEVGAGRFGFAHAIVRSTLLDGMSATRLALAHRHVAEAIEVLGRPDHDQLALHWQLAGVEDKAHEHLELAARRDLGALAYESAAERYETVLRYQQRRPTRDVRATARAWLGVGRARRALGEVDFVDAVQEAGRLGRTLGDVDLVADAATASLLPGTYFVAAGQDQAAEITLCEAALELLPTRDPRRARVLSTLAAHLTFEDDRDRRVALIREAHDLARAVGDPELIGSVLVVEFLALWDPTTFARRAEIAREVARMARAAADTDLAFFAGFFSAICATERGDLAEARTRLAALDGPVTASQNQYFGFLVERLSVSIDVLTRHPDAQSRIDALAARYDGTRADTAGTWSLQTGALTRQVGGLGGFAPALRTMLEESAIAATWRAPYGLALLDEGDRDGAMAVLEGFEEPPLDFFWLTNIQAMAELAVGLERDDVARRMYDLLLPFRDQLGITASGSLCLGFVATTLGELAVFLGDETAAIDLLVGAVAGADAMEAPYEAVKARRLLATALARSEGRADEAADIVEAATALARSHGLTAEERLLTELL
jgi:tetratricopeptide (TPR) repeat protein